MKDFDRYPRIPRRRDPVLTTLVQAIVSVLCAVAIGWMAAEGF